MSVRCHRGQRTFGELPPGIYRNQLYATTGCKRKVQMTPLCKVEMALPGFRDPGMYQLQHEAADRKEGRPPPPSPLHFVR